MTKLPDGWQNKTLSEVCDLITDGSHFSPRTQDSGYPYITVRDLNEKGIDFAKCKFISQESFDELEKNGCRPKTGDVLFSKDGTVGKVAQVLDDTKFVVLSSLAILRPNRDFLTSEFLKYALKSPELLENALGMKTGTALRRVVLRNLKTLEIPIPPIEEQRKIVELLEDHLSRLDAALADVKQAKIKAAQFRRSLFYSVFNGFIAEFGKKADWVNYLLGDIVENLDNRRIPVNSTERSLRLGKVPYYGATGQVGTIDKPIFDDELLLLGEDGVQFFDPDKSKAYLIAGPSWVNNHAHVLRANDSIVSQKLLMHYLNQFNYVGYANGTTRLKLTQGSMNTIPVSLPSRPMQEQMIDFIDQQFSIMDASVKAAEIVAIQSVSLRRSLLQSAFTGQLSKEILSV